MTTGIQFIGMTVVDNQVNTQNDLAKAGSSWKLHVPLMLPYVQRLPPRVPLPGVQVRGHRPLAQARTGPGVRPAGGTLFNENVENTWVLKGFAMTPGRSKSDCSVSIFAAPGAARIPL